MFAPKVNQFILETELELLQSSLKNVPLVTSYMYDQLESRVIFGPSCPNTPSYLIILVVMCTVLCYWHVTEDQLTETQKK